MIKSLFAILPVLLLSVGCAQLTPFTTPTAQIKSMKIADVSSEGFTMDFGVAVNNPNKVELPVSSADYKLELAGVGVVNDTATTSAAIPAEGTTSVTVPVRVKFQDLLKAKSALAGAGGDVAYNLEGGVDFNPEGLSSVLGTRALRVPLKYSGTLRLRQIFQENMDAVSKSPAAQEILGQLMSGGLGGLIGQ